MEILAALKARATQAEAEAVAAVVAMEQRALSAEAQAEVRARRVFQLEDAMVKHASRPAAACARVEWVAGRRVSVRLVVGRDEAGARHWRLLGGRGQQRHGADMRTRALA